MRYFNSNFRTAILMMAVLVCGLMMIGCVATQRDATEIKAKLNRIEASQSKTDELAARMDSLMAAGTEADNKLRNDIRYSVDELNQQLSTMLENYNELIAMVAEIQRGQQSRPVKLMPSPGASDTASYIPSGPTSTTMESNQEPIGGQEDMTTPPPPVMGMSDEECTIAFETAFTSLRQNEYDSSETQFKRFMDNCPQHEKMASAHWWLGENYYRTKKYAESIEQFEIITKDYQDFPDMSQVLYKIARDMEELGRKTDAKKMYKKVVDDYPGSFSASQASERLKDI